MQNVDSILRECSKHDLNSPVRDTNQLPGRYQ